MGDMRILCEELELGLPFESAALLAGYDFDEIELLKEEDEVAKIIAEANAKVMHEHLQNIRTHSEVNPRMSTWLLERRFPRHFSQANRNVEQDEFVDELELRGVSPNGGHKTKDKES